MRMSDHFVQTLREAPSDARSAGYRFLLRGGFMRPLTGGSCSFLPLGMRTYHQVEGVVRRMLDSIGAQEVSLPTVQPAELTARLGEIDRDAGRQVRFRDREQHEMVLDCGGNEAAVLATVGGMMQSYRQLPVLLYRVWQQFGDEDRLADGLLGAREARVVDVYSFHTDDKDLVSFYPRIQSGFADVFQQCGLQVCALGGGSDVHNKGVAHRFVLPFASGQVIIVRCPICGYIADQATARIAKESLVVPGEMAPMQDVETPNCKTIADLAAFLGIPESRTAKALFLVAGIEGEGDRFVFAVVRGDTSLNEAKLKRVLNAKTIGPATEAEIRSVGAEPGYGSPVGLQGIPVVVDDLVVKSPNLVAGANRPGYHTLNVNYGRDYVATIVADIVLAEDGSPCSQCRSPLTLAQGVELAAVRSMGDYYSRMMGATYLDNEGHSQPIVMGHYRLHLDRLIGAVAESWHDEHGIIWPSPIAPFDVYLMTLGKMTAGVVETADRLYADLTERGFGVLYDDRDERAGVKFNDADLLGIPLRIAVGERGLKNGTVELKRRNSSEIVSVALDEVVAYVEDLPPASEIAVVDS